MPTPCSVDWPVHVSLGMYGRLPHGLAIARALADPPVEPLLGPLSTTRLQLCPQNRGRVDREMAAALRQLYPGIEWRLHANVQVGEQPRLVALCDWPRERAWFTEAARVSAALDAPVYTAHAGRREATTVTEVLCHVREVEQLFGIPVGIEGHYPTPRDTWLFSTWAEYRLLLESGVHYALDLSHLNILAVQSGVFECNLVRELLASPKCLEVHLSANDGSGDQHLPLDTAPWWWPLLDAAHDGAVLFSEGRAPQFPI